MSERNAVPGDFIHDPTFATQRHIARYLIGALINELRGRNSLGRMRYKELSPKDFADQAETLAREWGIIAPPDGLKHAPMCPANLWAGQMLPFQPCNCGADT